MKLAGCGPGRTQGALKVNRNRGDAARGLLNVFTTQDASEDFRLPFGQSGIVREGNPERHTDAVTFVASEEKAAAGGIARLALLDLLAEGRNPTEPCGKAEPNSAMLAALHGGVTSWSCGWVASQYKPLLIRAASPRTRAKLFQIRIAVYGGR